MSGFVCFFYLILVCQDVGPPCPPCLSDSGRNFTLRYYYLIRVGWGGIMTLEGAAVLRWFDALESFLLCTHCSSNTHTHTRTPPVACIKHMKMNIDRMDLLTLKIISRIW